MAGKGQFAGFAIDPEGRDIICALVAYVKELARRIEVEASRIISASPFLCHEGEFAVFADGKYPDAIVQTVSGVNKAAIG